MKTVVLKFGGTSVGSIDRIKKVCKIIASYRKKRNKVIVISSAMSGVSNELVKKSKQISNNFDNAEYDTLVSTGEQVSCALIAGRLNHIGIKSRSWLSWQIPIVTEGPYSAARINKIFSKELHNYLKTGGIPVITGFQGINNKFRLTTIGRSGSDATAIMLAKFLKADECIIYTDVDGVYTTDPRLCIKARKLDKLTYEEMLEMSGLGSKVLQLRAVEFASKYNVPVRVLDAHNTSSGTLITKEEKKMEGALISGIAFTKDEAEVMIKGVKDQPGVAAKILAPIGDAKIEVDMIVQNVGSNGMADFTFTVSRNTLKKALQVIEKNKKTMMYQSVTSKRNIVKVSIVGVGMRSHAGIAGRMFKCLAKNKVNIRMISTTEIKISVVIDQKNLELAVNALHNEFKLENK